MGENGAGKSTLVKIMAGLHLSDKGAIRISGEEMLFRSPSQAQQAGVSVIYQEPTLFRDLSIAENVFMHRQPKTAYGWIDYARNEPDRFTAPEPTGRLAAARRSGAGNEHCRPANRGNNQSANVRSQGTDYGRTDSRPFRAKK